MATKWGNHGFSVDDVAVWAATGATPFQAAEYRAAGFGPEETAAWMAVPDGLATFPPTGPMARRWMESPIYHDGITPADAHAWRGAGIESPDRAAEAFGWADRLGYADNADGDKWEPEDGPYPAEVQASVWARARFAPAEAQQWQQAGFTFDDGRGPSVARVWAGHIDDAEGAAAWRRVVGNNPGSAAALVRLGVTPDTYVTGDETFVSGPEAIGVFKARAFWRDIGVTDGREAQGWFAVGFDPWTAGEWKAADPTIDPATAASWKHHGFSPSVTAAWLAAFPFRCNPTQALRMSEAGWSPDTVKDELAGMPAEEAVRFADHAPVRAR
ncbi:hypothetical protein DVS28_b0140 (plasmid) [Euzebya pacifica]|uniref:Uncharacterized protein n=1 Tax=Euzebya pacifica TaxID=1608957 RepID=A0A346Y613_9ACTN|nr:hypothetical protein [Euzebya pacifica]AXV09910.1 hypothetical protein DVS28_b0140 [Euzebya pacifica]